MDVVLIAAAIRTVGKVWPRLRHQLQEETQRVQLMAEKKKQAEENEHIAKTKLREVREI